MDVDPFLWFACLFICDYLEATFVVGSSFTYPLLCQFSTSFILTMVVCVVP